MAPAVRERVKYLFSDAKNHGCWLLEWFGTKSITMLKSENSIIKSNIVFSSPYQKIPQIPVLCLGSHLVEVLHGPEDGVNVLIVYINHM